MDDELREARRLADIYRRLRTSGGTLESTAGSQPLDPADVKNALRKELAKAKPQVDGDEAFESVPMASPEVSFAASDVMAAADRAMSKVEEHNEASLTDFEFAALEAIVLVVGRPSVRYANGRVGMPNPDGENSRWSTLIAIARNEIDTVSASVGRVGIARENASDQTLGTAWRLGEDLVVTNRHVAKLIVDDPALAPSEWKLDAAKLAVADFTVTDQAKKSIRFPIAELVYCAEEKDVDLAILRLAAGGATLPDALDLDWDPDALGSDAGGTFTGQEIYVVGHPLRLSGGNAVSSVFGKADGFKRWSPGLVTALVSPRPIFEHDCSTLGGNSGSCVLSVSGHAVVGLHYAGLNVDTVTDIGRANAALALSQLDKNHRAAEILKQGHA